MTNVYRMFKWQIPVAALGIMSNGGGPVMMLRGNWGGEWVNKQKFEL